MRDPLYQSHPLGPVQRVVESLKTTIPSSLSPCPRRHRCSDLRGGGLGIRFHSSRRNLRSDHRGGDLDSWFSYSRQHRCSDRRGDGLDTSFGYPDVGSHRFIDWSYRR